MVLDSWVFSLKRILKQSPLVEPVQNQSIKVAVFVVTYTVPIYDGHPKFQVKEKVL